MRQSVLDEKYRSDLVELIYGAVIGESSWQHFLDHLNAAMDHGKTTLMFHDAIAGTGTLSLNAGYSSDEIRAYHENYGARNPWMAKAAVRTVGVGVTSDKMLDPSLLRKTDFYSDYLTRSGLEGGAGITIFREQGRSFILTSLMSRRDHAGSAAFAELFTALAPHLARAFYHYRKTPAEGQAIAGSEGKLLDASGIGMLIVDERRYVKAMNRTGDDYMEAGCGLSLSPTRRLMLSDPAVQQELERLSRRDFVGSTISRHRVSMPRAWELTLVRMNSDPMREFLAGPSVALLIRMVSGAISADSGLLSPSETEVARAVCDGSTVNEIARRRGVSPETIRSQLKSIYRKLDVSNRVELLRALQ